MTRLAWFAASVLASILLAGILEALLWQAGRRWYYGPPFPAHECAGCAWEKEWIEDHSGA